MKPGIQKTIQYKLDNEKLKSIEIKILELINNQMSTDCISGVIPDLETLRIKASNGKTTLWILARHSDRRSDLLIFILKKFADEMMIDDIKFAVTEGYFKGKTVQWLMEVAPIDNSFEIQEFISKLMGFEFTPSYIPRYGVYVGAYDHYDNPTNTRHDKGSLADSYMKDLPIYHGKVRPYS